MKLTFAAAIFAALIACKSTFATSPFTKPSAEVRACVEALCAQQVDSETLTTQLYGLADGELSPKSKNISKQVLEIYAEVLASKPKDLSKQLESLVTQIREHSEFRSDKVYFKKTGKLLISTSSTYYYAIDIERPEFYASASLNHKGGVSMTFALATPESKRIHGKEFRSKVLRGREQYFAMFNHFGGHKRVTSIDDLWMKGSDTYAYFKKLRSENVPAKKAVWMGFTGKMAREAGFTKATVNLNNYHGDEKELINWPRDEVEVKFSR